MGKTTSVAEEKSFALSISLHAENNIQYAKDPMYFYGSTQA